MLYQNIHAAPHDLHWKAVKRILQYIQGTRTYGIHYVADSDWSGDSIDQKSTSRYVFMFGGGPICCSSKRHSSIALSSAEAEYRGVVNACIQAIWLQGILSEFDLGSTLSTVLFCDNQSAIVGDIYHRTHYFGQIGLVKTLS